MFFPDCAKLLWASAGNVTSVVQHFRPTVLPSYDTSDLRITLDPTTAVGWMIFLIRPSKDCRYCQYVVDVVEGRCSACTQI